MVQYSTHHVHSISELEVFVGNIIGKRGAQSKQQRENSIGMREKHEIDVKFTINCIRKGENMDDEGGESLERSIACLKVAVDDLQTKGKKEMWRSFGYIAAATCLKEIDKLKGVS